MSEWTIWRDCLTGCPFEVPGPRRSGYQPLSPFLIIWVAIQTCVCPCYRRCAEVKLTASLVAPADYQCMHMPAHNRGVVWHDVLIESCDEPYEFQIKDALSSLIGIPSISSGAR